MYIFWMVALLMGAGLYLTARDSSSYGLRLISRTFGPLLAFAGLVGCIVTPSSGMLALAVLGSVVAGVVVTILVLLVMRMRRRATR